MKRSILGCVMALGLSAVPAMAAQYEFENCNSGSAEFSLKYTNLVENEPAIGAAFDKIVHTTGSTKLTDCYFMVPVADGQPVAGTPRRLVLYKNWDRVEIISGLEKRTPQQAGLVVEYLVKERPLSDGNVGVSREVISLQVCRRPDACSRMGVQR